MTTDFLPSAVRLDGSFPPLTATMRKAEAEAAATLLVIACRANGDSWDARTLPEIGAAIDAELNAERAPLHDLRNNPFWRPSIPLLVEFGFARWTRPDETESGSKSPLEFTATGIEALRKYVVQRTPEKIATDEGVGGG